MAEHVLVSAEGRGRQLALQRPHVAKKDQLRPALLGHVGHQADKPVDEGADPAGQRGRCCRLVDQQVDGGDAAVAAVDAAIAKLLGIDAAFGEPIQGQRYAPGQEFKPHTDTFEPGRADYFEHCAEAGNRTWTAMVYLNDVEAGGATRFKTLGKTIQPERGKLLSWNNLLADGVPNPATLHQGMKVRSGTKYILTKWWRERALTA